MVKTRTACISGKRHILQRCSPDCEEVVWIQYKHSPSIIHSFVLVWKKSFVISEHPEFCFLGLNDYWLFYDLQTAKMPLWFVCTQQRCKLRTIKMISCFLMFYRVQLVRLLHNFYWMANSEGNCQVLINIVLRSLYCFLSVTNQIPDTTWKLTGFIYLCACFFHCQHF